MESGDDEGRGERRYRCEEAQAEEESCVYILQNCARVVRSGGYLTYLIHHQTLHVHIFWHPVTIDACNMWHMYRTTFFSAPASMCNS